MFRSSCILLFFTLAYCLPQESASLSLQSRQSCENSPTSRECWGQYSIDTDYYTVFPDTGVTREYWLVAQNVTISPDGYERKALVINGTMPGPTIEADWGDTIMIHVTNEMDDGTAIHWHGIRQFHSVMADGVPGVTQCPIPPGETMTYKFKATQYGTSWYHSHFSLQLGDGMLGPIVIHGPATANYDVDLGPFVIQDWGHVSAFTIWTDWTRLDQQHKLALFQPALENGLIGGENTYDCTKSTDPACTGRGKRTEAVFEPGKKYRLRLVGAQIDGYFKFTIDGHKFTVISNDFVPIKPYQTDNVIIVSGQRYDIVVEANQPIGNYWMRAIYQTACNQNDNDNKDNIRGIVRYAGAATDVDPTTSQWSGIKDSCGDEPYSNLVPWVKMDVGESSYKGDLPVRWYYELNLAFHWTLGTGTMIVNWSDPTVSQLYHGDNQFEENDNVIRVTQSDKWTYWVITDQTIVNVYHPMHLHGHDLFVLAQGRGIFNPLTVKLNTVNPPRRDTVSIEGTGYLVIAFLSDNPGSWLFHCHIAWHASQGLSLQYMERESEIPGLIDASSASAMDSQCAKWRDWYKTTDHPQDDSGI
ncbi:hypothetical protein P152DRAFT_395179 [Eremomyces bilateralis CBS 781.70]|uniref:Multicopper oxidase n=1 Tax=Eremomyces bilateralis CBS 781.70 TaxID=1392243 RepID=A0A6G1G687_9PEZI|nr:uncharacterized protein P152DRAFT_395179 [Eremomyces bilateralis CBS 781.70]KAF1813390.1 hypothetical protein P152DRAFT_395179 [Eremomyces bilateralis CBS 781.70]